MIVQVRMARVVLSVLSFVLLAASPAFGQASAGKPENGRARPPVTLQVDPLLIAEAGEMWGLIAAANNPIWPGWDASSTPLLIYLPGDQDVLINHPHPPEGFVSYDGAVKFPGGKILVKNGPTLIEWDGQNTSQDVEGIRTLVVADPLSNLRVQVSGLLLEARPAAEKVQALRFSDLARDPYSQLAMSFTPFGITVVDGERTIFTQVPIAVAFGKDGQVAQKVAAPLLRDTGRRLVRFRLPPGATRAEVEKALGAAQTDGAAVADLTLDLPGATVKAAKAQTRWTGDDLIIVLLKGDEGKQ